MERGIFSLAYNFKERKKRGDLYINTNIALMVAEMAAFFLTAFEITTAKTCRDIFVVSCIISIIAMKRNSWTDDSVIPTSVCLGMNTMIMLLVLFFQYIGLI